MSTEVCELCGHRIRDGERRDHSVCCSGRKQPETTVVQEPDLNVSQIIAYEQGDLSEEEVITLFQKLIDSGLAWTLQGHYGRTAMRLIEEGVCNPKNSLPTMRKPY